MTFSFDDFVSAARVAVNTATPTQSIRQLMETTLQSPDALVAANPLPNDEEEVLLFEDETVSVWVCRFSSDLVVPPHEHKMNAFIGVFEGCEKNIFFKREYGQLKHMSTKTVDTGQLLSIGSDGLHSVVADGNQSCCSLHVYTGPLTTIKRCLFDWDSGNCVDFTDDNYHRMKRPVQQLSSYLL